jgi:sugar lactone lactonase YvrE
MSAGDAHQPVTAEVPIETQASQESFMIDPAPAIHATPEVVVDLPSITGEGPLWHPQEQMLYWVDIPAGRLYRYDPVSGGNEVVFQHEAEIGGFTFQADGALLLFCSYGTILRLHQGAVTTVVASIQGEEGSRFNDVIAAPGGQVFCGTMPTGDTPGRLYRLDHDGSLTTLFDNIGCSNGFGFTADERTMYYTDTTRKVIWTISLDPVTGEIGGREELIDTSAGPGGPDGMCVDAEGTIWSARWDGNGLYRYAADGTLLGKVTFPVRKVSSVAFGGPDLATAYVTTAGGANRGPDEGEFAGSLFRVDLGVSGKPVYFSRVLL